MRLAYDAICLRSICIKAHVKPRESDKNEAFTFFYAPSFSACLLFFRKIIDRGIKHIVPGTLHCFATDIFDTSAKCIFTYTSLDLYGSTSEVTASSSRFCFVRLWYSALVFRWYAYIRWRIVTNEFVPGIPHRFQALLSRPSPQQYQSRVHNGELWDEKKEESEPLLKPYTKKTESDYQLWNCYIRMPSAIFSIADDYQVRRIEEFVEFSNFTHVAFYTFRCISKRTRHRTERKARSANISDLY